MPASQQSYRMMREAASMFYFLADQLRGRRPTSYANRGTRAIVVYARTKFFKPVCHISSEASCLPQLTSGLNLCST